MLAKQGWQLLVGDDSLFYRLFKAKYFPNTTFLEAQSKKAASWAWHSIIASKGVVERGWKWGITNGQRAKIWGEPWLNDPQYLKIVTPNPNYSRWTRVCDLVNEDSIEWKEATIREIFNGQEAKQIMRIPLSRTSMSDRRIWRSTANGKFTVKSAYIIAKEMIQQTNSRSVERGQASGSCEDDGKWARIWHIKAQRKIKFFIWRCLQNIVPVNTTLAQRQIQVDVTCPVCGLEQESISHMLFNCDRARRVWLLSPFSFRPEVMETAQLGDVWKGVGLNGQGEDKWTALGMFATFCWHIWLARNEWIFKGDRVDETRIHAKAMDDFSSYVLELSNIGAAAIDTRTEESRIGWVPPAVGVLKVNVDGAFDAKSGRGGVGLVLWDYRGDILEAQAIPILQSSSAKSIETLGVRFALFAAVKDMSKDYIVEGDAQTVLKMLQGTSNVKASVEVVIKDSINLASCLNSCSFSFVPRVCNRVANAIAKYALSLAITTTWHGNFPSWVCREAALDVPVSF